MAGDDGLGNDKSVERLARFREKATFAREQSRAASTREIEMHWLAIAESYDALATSVDSLRRFRDGLKSATLKDRSEPLDVS
jgi:hypothetical protein